MSAPGQLGGEEFRNARIIIDEEEFSVGLGVLHFYKFNIYNSSNLASFSPTQLQRKLLPFKLLLLNND